MCHTWKNGPHLEKMGQTLKNASNLEKWVALGKMRVWYRMHESELENGLYHAGMLERMRLTYCVLPQGKALNVSVKLWMKCIVYLTYS